MDEAQYKLTTSALFQEVMDEAVILDSQTGQYFTLDAVGTLMVQTLAKGQNIQQVVSAVEQHYEATEQQIKTDLLDLVAQMQEKGLLIPA